MWTACISPKQEPSNKAKRMLEPITLTSVKAAIRHQALFPMICPFALLISLVLCEPAQRIGLEPQNG